MFMTDAAQSAGRIEMNVRQLDSTFTTFCGRKGLMGPQGTGFLYGKKDELRKLVPLTVGSLGGQLTSETAFHYLDLPFRFEAGVVNTAGIIGLGAATNSLKKIGAAKIRSRISSLTRELKEKLQEINGVQLYGPEDIELQAGIVSWNLDHLPSEYVASKMWRKSRVAVASGDQGSLLATSSIKVPGVVRSSVHYFNNEQDIDNAINAIKHLG
jgi:cysteine desulfurase / selenocysteine lyase